MLYGVKVEFLSRVFLDRLGSLRLSPRWCFLDICQIVIFESDAGFQGAELERFVKFNGGIWVEGPVGVCRNNLYRLTSREQVNLRGEDNSIGSRAGNGFGVRGTVKCDSCRRRKQKVCSRLCSC